MSRITLVPGCEQFQTPSYCLYLAVKEGKEDKIPYFRRKGAHPDTSLQEAAKQNDVVTMTKLIQLGATRLDLAAYEAGKAEQEDSIYYLSQKGYGDSALEGVIEVGNLSLMTELLSQRKWSQAQLDDALHVAVKHHQVKLLPYLLGIGADIDAGLQAAGEVGSRDLVQMFIERGASPGVGVYGAAKTGQLSVLLALLEKYPIDDTEITMGTNIAAQYGQLAAVAILIRGRSVPLTPALERAVRGNHLTVVRYLGEEMWSKPGSRNQLVRYLGRLKSIATNNGYRKIWEYLNSLGEPVDQPTNHDTLKEVAEI